MFPGGKQPPEEKGWLPVADSGATNPLLSKWIIRGTRSYHRDAMAGQGSIITHFVFVCPSHSTPSRRTQVGDQSEGSPPPADAPDAGGQTSHSEESRRLETCFVIVCLMREISISWPAI